MKIFLLFTENKLQKIGLTVRRRAEELLARN